MWQGEQSQRSGRVQLAGRGTLGHATEFSPRHTSGMRQVSSQIDAGAKVYAVVGLFIWLFIFALTLFINTLLIRWMYGNAVTSASPNASAQAQPAEKDTAAAADKQSGAAKQAQSPAAISPEDLRPVKDEIIDGVRTGIQRDVAQLIKGEFLNQLREELRKIIREELGNLAPPPQAPFPPVGAQAPEGQQGNVGSEGKNPP